MSCKNFVYSERFMATANPVVLAVDDNEAHRYIMSRMLRSLGFGVLEAATARDALRLALEKNPEVVLMDVNLPDGNGIDICRQIREQRDSTAVVLHTSTSPFDIMRTRGEYAGADGFLM